MNPVGQAFLTALEQSCKDRGLQLVPAGSGKGNGHYHVLGGEFLVNVYPSSKKGPSAYVAGATKKMQPVTAAEVTKLAMGKSRVRAVPVHPRGSSRKYTVFKDKVYDSAAANRKNVRCYWCRDPVLRSDATVEHLVPRSHGGLNIPNNWVLACSKCNHARGNRTLPPGFEPRGRVEMPIGSFRGQDIDDVPSEYLEWLMTGANVYADAKLLAACTKELDWRTKHEAHF